MELGEIYSSYSEVPASRRQPGLVDVHVDVHVEQVGGAASLQARLLWTVAGLE